MASRKPVESSANDPALEKLLEGVNPKKPISEKKFQAILDHYNTRNPDKAAALTGVKYFVHRTFPRIDGRRTHRKYGYIEKVDCVAVASGTGAVEEVNELPSDLRAWITSRHGGGRYQVRVNDAHHSSESEEVALTAIKVDEIETPPILNPAELVDTDQETLNWITRNLQLGLLMRVGEPPNTSYAYPGDRSAPAQTGAAPAGEQGGLAQVAMEALRQRDTAGDHAARRAIDLIADTAKSVTPAAVAPPDTVGQFKAMAEVLQGNKGGDGIASIVPLLITMMQENGRAQNAAAERQAAAQAENFRMQMEMMKMQMDMMRGKGKDGDELGKLERMMELAGKMGGGGWSDTIKEMLPLVLPFMMRGMGPLPAAQPQPQPDQIAAPGGVPGGVPGAAPGGRLTPAQVEDFSGRALTCMNRGQDGSDFANGIEVIFSPAAYDTLRAMGKDNLIAVVLQSSRAAAFQAKGEATAQFIQEFIDYGAGSEDGAAPGTPPAQAAATPVGAAA